MKIMCKEIDRNLINDLINQFDCKKLIFKKNAINEDILKLNINVEQIVKVFYNLDIIVEYKNFLLFSYLDTNKQCIYNFVFVKRKNGDFYLCNLNKVNL